MQCDGVQVAPVVGDWKTSLVDRTVVAPLSETCLHHFMTLSVSTLHLPSMH